MATPLYGVNATIDLNNSGLIPAAELGGKVKVAYDSYTTVGNVADAEEILFMKLPAGARVVNAQLWTSASLGAGTLSLGHKATKTADGSTDLVADADAFAATLDVSSAAASVILADTPTLAGFFYKFGAETQVYATKNTQSSSGAGETIKVAIYYIVD
jgi:hypothetical protein